MTLCPSILMVVILRSCCSHLITISTNSCVVRRRQNCCSILCELLQLLKGARSCATSGRNRPTAEIDSLMVQNLRWKFRGLCAFAIFAFASCAVFTRKAWTVRREIDLSQTAPLSLQFRDVEVGGGYDDLGLTVWWARLRLLGAALHDRQRRGRWA